MVMMTMVYFGKCEKKQLYVASQNVCYLYVLCKSTTRKSGSISSQRTPFERGVCIRTVHAAALWRLRASTASVARTLVIINPLVGEMKVKKEKKYTRCSFLSHHCFFVAPNHSCDPRPYFHTPHVRIKWLQRPQLRRSSRLH